MLDLIDIKASSCNKAIHVDLARSATVFRQSVAQHE